MEITDAYATPYMNKEIQGILRYYDRTGNDENRLLMQPRLEYGFAQIFPYMPEMPTGPAAGRAV